jgi:hypothetical protein
MRQVLETQPSDWRPMAVRLERLKACGTLEEAEVEMIAVLKFSSNLLLREQVLLHARHIAVPSDRLLTALLDVICNRELFVDERTLAAQALSALVARLNSKADDQVRKWEMVRKLSQTLALPEPQVLRQAVEKVIERIQPNTELPREEGQTSKQ